MKKHFYSILILIISSFLVWLNVRISPKYQVLEVKREDIYCIDFNRNSKCDVNEDVRLYGVKVFPEKFGKRAQALTQKYPYKEENFVVLSQMAKKFAKQELLNNYVNVRVLDKTSSPKYSIAQVYLNNTDFSQILIKNGFALAFKDEYKLYENHREIKKNINLSKKLNYKLKNLKNGKIHKLDCEYGRLSKKYEIGIFEDDVSNGNLCGYCHNKIKKSNHKKKKVSPSNFDYISDNMRVYFLDFSNQKLPDSTCSKKACQILLENINNAQKSIDFAIYGLGNIPKIQNALIEAQARGVKVRYVIDNNSNKENVYKLTSLLNEKILDYKTDYIEGETKKFNDFIMHNKFFIFDESIVWTGSANVSETDLSGFNANNVIVINSKEIANIYKKEFEQMYFGKFHTYKEQINSKTFDIDGFPLTVAFSPQDKTIVSFLLPLIDEAKNTIFVSSYIITHKAFAEHLVLAKKRGIDVKVIVDATSSASSYSMVKYLRSNDIPVKIENFAGKMHMKTMVLDDYVVLGSMNFTKSGESYNDENVLIIKNNDLAFKVKSFFDYNWENISEEYLTKFVSAESKYSVGSCSDGIDNDYDGKVDYKDEGCK